MQLEAVKPSGEPLYAWAVLVTPSISDEELLGTDDWDWQSALDLASEKSFIPKIFVQFKGEVFDAF